MMPICYGHGGCIRFLPRAEQPLFDPLNPKQPGSKQKKGKARVMCIETGTVYGSTMAAARAVASMGIAKSAATAQTAIANTCSGIQKTAYGYHWRKV